MYTTEYVSPKENAVLNGFALVHGGPYYAGLIHCTRPSRHSPEQTVHEYARHEVCLKTMGTMFWLKYEYQAGDSNPVLIGVQQVYHRGK